MPIARWWDCAKRFAWLALLPAVLAGCGRKHPMIPIPPQVTRSWFMGFSAIPPTISQDAVIHGIDVWSLRADAAIAHDDVPWEALLSGTPAETAVVKVVLPLAQYYRAKGLRFYTHEIELTNGLDRGAEAPALVALGRSISEEPVRAVARAWAAAIDSIVNPDYLGLGSETNLVRLQAPSPLYASLASLSRSIADTLALMHARMHRARNPVLYTSIQVDVAWGLAGGHLAYGGIATDLADFPFTGAIGLSSYPYLAGFTDPDSIPMDYYLRIANDANKPVLVVEGGWASATPPGSPTNPAWSPPKQTAYVRAQAQRLAAARAVGYYQLTFTDLDLNSWPAGIGPFATLGLADVNFAAKPALTQWDSLFAMPQVP